MTLKKQFEDAFKSGKRFDIQNAEKIADDFAIGFAEVLINYNYHPMHKVWIRYDKMANQKFTTKELLEIYKKQKKL